MICDNNKFPSQNAINLWDKDEILKRYFQSPALPTGDKRSIVIFHCEFSSKRGPEMYVHNHETSGDIPSFLLLF